MRFRSSDGVRVLVVQMFRQADEFRPQLLAAQFGHEPRGFAR
jgi:hypothetical protein